MHPSQDNEIQNKTSIGLCTVSHDNDASLSYYASLYPSFVTLHEMLVDRGYDVHKRDRITLNRYIEKYAKPSFEILYSIDTLKLLVAWIIVDSKSLSVAELRHILGLCIERPDITNILIVSNVPVSNYAQKKIDQQIAPYIHMEFFTTTMLFINSYRNNIYMKCNKVSDLAKLDVDINDLPMIGITQLPAVYLGLKVNDVLRSISNDITTYSIVVEAPLRKVR